MEIFLQIYLKLTFEPHHENTCFSHYLNNNCTIRITCPCNEHPLTPHFYIEKVGFTRVYIFFLFLLQNIDCGYSLEPPRYVLSKNKKNIKNFHLKIINFTAVKYCCILHGHVCVMNLCSDTGLCFSLSR